MYYVVHNVRLPEKYKMKGQNGPIRDISTTLLFNVTIFSYLMLLEMKN